MTAPSQPTPRPKESPTRPDDAQLPPVDTLLNDQSQRWRQGDRVLVEDYLASHPPLRADDEAVLDLLYHEIVLRAGKGEHPQIDEYAHRFPELQSQIQVLFRVHRVIEQVPGQDPPTLPTGMDRTSATGTDIPIGWPTIPGFEILGKLGEGGMGVVYKAWQNKLNRIVALKMLLARAGAHPHKRARFQIEAKAVARLQHPHIVQIYDVGEQDGSPFLVLEFVEGGSLAQKLTGEPQPPQQAARLVETLAWAMHHAHQRDIIHRDLKPGNVLLTADGSPKITDFGLAKLLEEEGGLTKDLDVFGTASYMAPEQAAGRIHDIGPATDIYALGAVLYELLTGQPPFVAETVMATLQKVQTDDPVPPSRYQSNVPRDLQIICLKCLHKVPARRYASAATLAEDLRRFLAGESILARPAGTGERVVKWARRRPALAVLLAVVVAMAAIGLPIVSWFWQNAEAKAQAEAEANRKLKKQLYFKGIGDAALELEARHVGRAEELLDEQPVALRGWEWFYLKRLRYGPPLVLNNRHANYIWGVAFSPNGRYMASVGADGFVTIREVTTGRELPAFKYPLTRGVLCGLAFNPSGRLLALGVRQDIPRFNRPAVRVRIWDIQEEKWLSELGGHTDGVTSVAYSPRGRYLASASLDKTVILWDAASGEQLHMLAGHSATVNGVAFTRDDHFLASASDDGTVRIWETSTGQEVRALDSRAGPLAGVACVPDPAGRGHLLAAAGLTGMMTLWVLETGEEISQYYTNFGGILSLTFSPDGKRLAAAGFGKAVQLWDVTNSQEVLSLRTSIAITSVAFSPSGHLLAAANLDGTVIIWDATPPEERGGEDLLTLHGHPTLVSSLAYSPDGRYLATSSMEGKVQLRDATTGQEIRTIGDYHMIISQVVFSPDSRSLATVCLDQTLTVWDVSTGEAIYTLKGFDFFTASFSPDGQYLATIQLSGTLRYWNARTSDPVELKFADGTTGPKLKADTVGAACVAFSPKGDLVATTGLDGRVKLWKTLTDESVRTLAEHRFAVCDAVFSPTQPILATAGWDGTVRLWDLETGMQIRSLTHGDVVPRLAFSPDGRLLASACMNGSVTVWDPATGQKLATLFGHKSMVTSVAFSPDGKRLASASGYRSEGEIKIWDATRWDLQPSPAH
jgi:WD40 repeat protein/tRNA A-37 threonylcarbamoyl transferase component Bud32